MWVFAKVNPVNLSLTFGFLTGVELYFLKFLFAIAFWFRSRDKLLHSIKLLYLLFFLPFSNIWQDFLVQIFCCVMSYTISVTKKHVSYTFLGGIFLPLKKKMSSHLFSCMLFIKLVILYF